MKQNTLIKHKTNKQKNSQRQRAVVSDVIQLNINEDPEDFARHESTIKS